MQKQNLINKGNNRENRNQINNTYKQGDKVLLKNAWKTKFNQEAYIDPYVITGVRNNVTVRAHKGRVTDTFKIRNLRSGPLWRHMTYTAVGTAKYSQ